MEKFHPEIVITSGRERLFKISAMKDGSSVKFNVLPLRSDGRAIKVAVGSHIVRTDPNIILATVYTERINGANGPFRMVGRRVSTSNFNNFVIHFGSSLIPEMNEAVKTGNVKAFKSIAAAYTARIKPKRDAGRRDKVTDTLNEVIALIEHSQASSRNGSKLLRLEVNADHPYKV